MLISLIFVSPTRHHWNGFCELYVPTFANWLITHQCGGSVSTFVSIRSCSGVENFEFAVVQCRCVILFSSPHLPPPSTLFFLSFRSVSFRWRPRGAGFEAVSTMSWQAVCWPTWKGSQLPSLKAQLRIYTTTLSTRNWKLCKRAGFFPRVASLLARTRSRCGVTRRAGTISHFLARAITARANCREWNTNGLAHWM